MRVARVQGDDAGTAAQGADVHGDLAFGAADNGKFVCLTVNGQRGHIGSVHVSLLTPFPSRKRPLKPQMPERVLAKTLFPASAEL